MGERKDIAALTRIFDQECERHGVYPLDDRGAARIAVPKPPPGGADPDRRHFIYYPGAVRLPETAAPNTKNRSHRITVRIRTVGEGVLVALGGQVAGYALYVEDGTPVYHYNYFGRERTTITSTAPLPEAASTLELEFLYDGDGAGKGGEAILRLNDQEVGRRSNGLTSRSASPA